MTAQRFKGQLMGMKWLAVLSVSLTTSFAFAAPSRSQGPASKNDVFSIKAPFEFFLKAPLKDLFAHRVAPGTGPAAENSDYSVQGELVYTSHTAETIRIPVEVKLRGNTSQAETECDFPKLKLKFKGDVAKGTLFEAQKEIGIGTHCSLQAGSSPRFRRLWGGKSPHRESLMYDMLEELRIPSYKTRRAYATYFDSSGEILASRADAFFLEDMSGIEARLGGQEVRGADVSMEKRNTGPKAPPYIFLSAQESPGVISEEAARILLFEIMVQNSDYHLRVYQGDGETRSLWNMKVLQLNSKRWLIFPYDFDLAGMVKGQGTFRGVDSMKHKFAFSVRQTVVSEFENHKAQLYQIAQSLTDDPEGVQSIVQRLDQFFADLPNWKN
jgi:hypothetical protein